jgi:hypothetical protein
MYYAQTSASIILLYFARSLHLILLAPFHLQFILSSLFVTPGLLQSGGESTYDSAE